MKIFLFPIEPLTERYSEQWLRWWPRELQRLGVDHVIVMGLQAQEEITQGEFLDVVDTHYWKATQLSAFTHLLRKGHVRDGDWVLLLDAWNPVLEQLAYMRDLGNVKFKIAGCWHAGSYDPWDLLGQNMRVRTWARHAEMGYMEALDLAFTATALHSDMLAQTRGNSQKIAVSGFPLYADEWAHHSKPWSERSRRVVFPHRLAVEKAPLEFEWIRDKYRQLYGDDLEWVRTKDVCTTKEEYYKLLGDSIISISTAYQETWGIAMLESASLGCWPVVPDRLSYREIYPREHRYLDKLEAVELVRKAAMSNGPYPYDGHRWTHAIQNIVACMEENS